MIQMNRRQALSYFLPAAVGLHAADEGDLALFFQLLSLNRQEADAALVEVRRTWQPGYVPMLAELLQLFAVASGSRIGLEATRAPIVSLLAEKTGQTLGDEPSQWSRWNWTRPYAPHPKYGEFKGLLYRNLDRRMGEFFPPEVDSRIRLDQVQWGGVMVNGIPPLVNPAMMAAKDAAYLKDSNVVFGVAREGEARAYPKRILAWHEMALDHIGSVDLTLVYCTLCGTVIPYRSETGGRKFTFGTSGLLYESSKLMFDEETKSLWSTLQGQPVIGKLARSGLQLEFEPVVTTTWGEWRGEHPETMVLSTDTGHRRDYSEGAAYRAYFATDELMFDVSHRDTRLKNKEEILAIRLAGRKPLAIPVRLLPRKGEFKVVHEGTEIVIHTSKQGANRAYLNGRQIPAHRAFWFGWITQYPDTVLLSPRRH